LNPQLTNTDRFVETHEEKQKPFVSRRQKKRRRQRTIPKKGGRKKEQSPRPVGEAEWRSTSIRGFLVVSEKGKKTKALRRKKTKQPKSLHNKPQTQNTTTT